MDRNGLYGLPLEEFTPARNELAKGLKGDAAAEVRALKKPSVPAWAVNQLARGERKRVRALLKAGEALRKAHEGLGSPGGRDKLQAAVERERDLVAELVELARPLLDDAGKATATNLERVRNTLHAAATDDALREELAAGRVVKDREAVGLGPLGFSGGSGTARGKEDTRAAGKRRAVRDARSRAEQAAKQLEAAEAALDRAREEAEQAERALRERQLALDQARRDAEQAEAALRRAEE